MKAETEKQIDEIHALICRGIPANDKLIKAALKVVNARHYRGDDGWDRLKNAIAELEDAIENQN